MSKSIDNLVTIGIPFYNAADFLESSIRSVINQTYTNWELILVDDGSSDNSVEIARTFIDKRIRVISDGVNRGLVYRLNQLSSLSNGEYYARMDADDIMHVERIKNQVAFLNNHSDVDVVGTSYFSIDVNNKVLGFTRTNPKPNSIKSIFKSGGFAHPSILGNTKWFKDNPYDEEWVRMEDFELWIRTVSFSKFENLPDPLLYYRNIGIPTLNKYIKSNLGVLRLLRNRKKYKIDLVDSITYSFIYICKIIVYRLFYCFGQMSYLIQKRSSQILDHERINANDMLTNSIRKL